MGEDEDAEEEEQEGLEDVGAVPSTLAPPGRKFRKCSIVAVEEPFYRAEGNGRTERWRRTPRQQSHQSIARSRLSLEASNRAHVLVCVFLRARDMGYRTKPFAAKLRNVAGQNGFRRSKGNSERRRAGSAQTCWRGRGWPARRGHAVRDGAGVGGAEEEAEEAEEAEGVAGGDTDYSLRRYGLQSDRGDKGSIEEGRGAGCSPADGRVAAARRRAAAALVILARVSSVVMNR